MATAGSLNVYLNAQTAAFDRKMRKSGREVRGFGRTATAAKGHMLGFAKIFVSGAAIYGAVRFLKSATKEAIAFEEQVAEVSTMLDSRGMGALEGFSRGLEALALQSGQTTKALARGLYDILSASIAVGHAMDVLHTGTMAAVAGLTDTGIATDAITTSLNAFRMEAHRATHVADVLFATVKRGKLVFPELAQSFGTVASTAKIAGMSFEETNAAIATMTRGGLEAAKATVALRTAVANFLNPAEGAAKIARKYGMELNTATLRAKGLVGVLRQLEERGAGPEELGKIFPMKRAIAGIAILMNDLQGYAKDIEGAYNAQGKALEAYDKMAEASAHTMSQVNETWTFVKRSVGLQLLPFLKWVTNAKDRTKAFRVELQQLARTARETEFGKAHEAYQATWADGASTQDRIDATRREIQARKQLHSAAKKDADSLRAFYGAIPGIPKTWLDRLGGIKLPGKNIGMLKEELKILQEVQREMFDTAEIHAALDDKRMASEQAFGKQLQETADMMAEINRLDEERLRTEHAMGLRMKFAPEVPKAAAGRGPGLPGAIESRFLQRAGQGADPVAKAAQEHAQRDNKRDVILARIERKTGGYSLANFG